MVVNRDLERSTERHWDMAAFLDVDYRRTLVVTVKIPSKQKEYVYARKLILLPEFLNKKMYFRNKLISMTILSVCDGQFEIFT